MTGFIRKLWRRHKVKAAEHRMYRDQRYVPGRAMEDAKRMNTGENRRQL